jgi:hypothetical protein
VSAPAHKTPRSLISEGLAPPAQLSPARVRQQLPGAVGGAFGLCCSDGKRRRSEARDLSRLSPGTSEATAPLCLFADEAEKQRKRKASLAERKERFRREARTDESVRILCAALIGAPFRYLRHSARATSLDTERSRTGSKSRTCVQSDTPPRASIPLSRPRRS